MTGLNPNYDTIPIPSLQNSQKKMPKILVYLRSPVPFDSAVPASAYPPHAPVAKERRLMTSQYPIIDRTDNFNPQWMQAVNG